MATPMFHGKSTALEVAQGLNVKLNGKVVLITGATSAMNSDSIKNFKRFLSLYEDIGTETGRALVSANVHVIITARDMNKRYSAEITACPYSKTVDGFESQFAVNHLAHFLLTTSLVSELKAGKPSRVILMSSLANKRGGIHWNDINWKKNYDQWFAFAQSKKDNIFFAKQFNKLYASEGIQACSLQPAGILTNLQEQHAMGWVKEDGTLIDIFKTIKQGASTGVYAALAPELDNHGGEYLEDCAISKDVNLDQTALGYSIT